MGRGNQNYDDVWEKLNELRQIRDALCELVGSDDNNALLKWIEEEKTLRHPCPGKFLLGLTKPRQDSAIKTWRDFLDTLKKKGVSQRNIDYLMDKLSREKSIVDAVNLFENMSTEIKNDFTDPKEKIAFRSFESRQSTR